ncbi:MAG: HD domain-containing protein [Bacteroidales bacterium]|nr:HD domain-containing protein [Bacteroidales bacterium]
MTREQFYSIQSWFEQYIEQFHSNDPAFQRNIGLKRDHSRRVWGNAADLGMSIPLKDNDQLIIETSGLLHDVGRFEQFRRYGTFSDKKSVNHAWLGVEVLKEKDILKDLLEDEREDVYTAILHHNRKEVPHDQDERQLRFIKLLRDADKLDIWRLVTDYYCGNGETNNTLQLDLPDKPEFNRKNIDDLMNGRLVDLRNLETLNDFKLLQVGWVYDLNFSRSYEILKEKGFLEKIFDSLPDTKEVRQVREEIQKYLKAQRIAQSIEHRA